MGTQGEKPDEKLTYTASFRHLGKNITELVWMLFAAYQWLIVIGVLIIVPISMIVIILPNADFSPEITVHGLNLYSLEATIISLAAATLSMGFAFYYFFIMRKKPAPEVRVKFCIMLVYSSVLFMLTTKAELAGYQYIFENLQYSETTVRLYDADTNELVLEGIGISGIGYTPDRRLPLKSVIFMTDEGWQYGLLDIHPREVTVSAPGYASKSALIGTKEGEQTVDVYLHKDGGPLKSSKE